MADASLNALAQFEQQIGSADWSRWSKNRYCFYDYAQYPPAGTTEMQFFTVPYGALDPVTSTVKTLEQTNMNESRSFGRVNYLICEIRTHIRIVPKPRQVTAINSLTAAIYKDYTALNNVLEDLAHMGTLIIYIGSKEYFDINQPFISAPPGFGPQIEHHAANTGGATQAFWFQQSPCHRDIYRIKPEQLVEAGQTFVTKITFDNAASPAITNLVNGATPKVEIGIIFDGYILRPIQ